MFTALTFLRTQRQVCGELRFRLGSRLESTGDWECPLRGWRLGRSRHNLERPQPEWQSLVDIVFISCDSACCRWPMEMDR
jgi:hypothetical protein